MTPILTSDPRSDVTSAAIYGQSDSNSDYVESRENLPTISANTPELAGHIHELQQIHKVAVVKLEEFSQPMKLFTQPKEVEPKEISNDETTPAKNHQDNGDTPLHINQPYFPCSPLTDASVASELPLLQPLINTGAAAHPSRNSKLPKVCVMAAANVLFSVYQDWVHQNTVTHMDDGINNNGKWQDR